MAEIDYEAFEGHTPGPLLVTDFLTQKGYNKFPSVMISSGPKELAKFSWSDNGSPRFPPRNESLANAHLWAAAPALLADNLRMREDLAEYATLIDLQHARMGEATKLWQQATGKDCRPDLGELLGWMLEGRVEAVRVLQNVLSVGEIRFRTNALASGVRDAVDALLAKLGETEVEGG